MGCTQNDNRGVCHYFDEDEDYDVNDKGLVIEYGFKKDGFCVVDEDPEPDRNCCYYESEYGDEEDD